MLGLGETDEEVLEVMRDLRAHNVDMLTIGQYLQPSDGHLPVLRYAPLESFTMFEQTAREMGFNHAACGPMVRSSYFADDQAYQAGVFVA
jgi:lipoic acid synthetase